MTKCLTVFTVLLGSLGIYLGIFIFVADKPLTIGFIHDAFDIKRTYAARTKSPKVIIAAGSGAMFGIRCAALEKLIKRPCVNGAITGELGLQYSIDLVKRLANRGDVLVMPLEYGFYGQSLEVVERQSTHPFRIHYDLGTIWHLPADAITRAFFQFDLKYLIGAVVEMSLAKVGISRRFNRDSLTSNGDMRFHTEKKGEVFQRFVLAQRLDTPRAESFKIGAGTHHVISALATWAHEQGVHIIGTLPTSFDDRRIDQGVVWQITQLFRGLGHEFFVIENMSQYPRSCFYDSAYHLNETCQQLHTRNIAKALHPLIKNLLRQ